MEVTKDTLQEIGARLKALRIEKGITYYRLQMDYRLFQHTINAIESGDNYSFNTLLRYCEAIGVKIQML